MDLAVLAAFSSHTADRTKPHHTIYFLQFKPKPAAQAAADELR